jgi:sarcosine oxidase
MAPVRDIAIVGAGLLGLAAARELAAAGRDVVVLEQATVGHPGSGSKGSCRIFRLGYDEAGYVTAARRARDLWLELEAASGRPLLYPQPQLSFGPQLDAVHAAMRQAGAPCELLPAAEAARRYPGLRAGGPALLETESAVIAADAALGALAAAAGPVSEGVRVTGLTDDGRRVTLRTTAGPVSARVAIVTAGPWTAGLLGGHARIPASARREQVAYFEPARPVPAATAWRDTPIFICHGDESPYGLPVPGSARYKIGIHQGGPPARPDDQDQSPDPLLLARLADAACRYLPGYTPVPVAAERCVYDNTPDENFVLDRVGNVVIGCGTSGHGFKFGPLFGRWLAALACGEPELPPAGFSLSRFAARRAAEPG